MRIRRLAVTFLFAAAVATTVGVSPAVASTGDTVTPTIACC